MENKLIPDNWLKAIVIVTGFLSFGIGGLALYGWHNNDIRLIQIRPDLIAIHYNLALAFVFYGAALWLLLTRQRRVAGFIGVGILCYGFLILAQYIFGVDVGADRPFFKPSPDLIAMTKIPVGGALSLCLGGLALILMTFYKRLKHPFLTVASITSLLIARSIMACFHYLVGVRMPMGWFHSMSILAAVGFIIISLGILAYIYKEESPSHYSVHWLPVSCIIASLTVSVCFWQAQVTKDQRRVGQWIDLNGLSISHQIKLSMDTRVELLKHVARTWLARGKPTPSEWTFESQSFLDGETSFQVLGWIDSSFQLQWLQAGHEKNFQAPDKKLWMEILRRPAKNARAQKQLTVTGPYRFGGDEPKFVVLVPLLRENVFDGVILGAVDQSQVFSSLMNRLVADDFYVRIDYGDKNFYETRVPAGSNEIAWRDPIPMNIGNTVWRLRIAPTPQFLDKNRSYLAETTLITGTLLSLFLGLVIYFLQSVRRRARELFQANIALEKEAILRKSTETSFADQSERLQSIMDAMGDGVMVADKSGRVIMMNPAARKIMRTDIRGLSPDAWTLPLDMFLPDTVTPYPIQDYPLLRASRGETVDNAEMFLRFRENSEEVWVSTTTRPVKDENGLKGAVSVFRDITELKKAEEKLRSQEINLQDAQHTAQIGSWEWDLRTNVITWSDELFRIYGQDPVPTELSYETVINFVHPDDQRLFRETVSKAYAEKSIFEFVHRILRPDGEVRTLHARGEVIKDKKQQPIKMVGTGQDITERKRAEDILQQSQEELRKLASIVESSDDAIVATTLEGIIISWNGGAEKIYGYKAEDVVGRSLSLLFPSENVKELNEILEKIKEGEHLHHYERVRIRKDGRSIHVSVTTSAVKNHKGEIVGTSVVARDISRRIEAEQALHESQELFHSFMNNSPTVAYMKDEVGRYVYINKMFERLHQQKLDDIQGKTDFDWLPDHVAAELQKNDKTALEADKMLEVIERVPVADGSIRDWLAFRFGVKSSSGKKFVGGVAIDISERRKAEEAVRRANADLELRVLERTKELNSANQNMQGEIIARKRIEKELAKRAVELASSNKELEQFALVASHDLQEPLRKISSYGELLAQRYTGRLDDKAEKFLGYMIDGVHRMQNLIKALLAYARVGKMENPLRPVDLAETVRDTLNDLESTIEETGAEISVENLPIVTGNPAQIGQLMQNLISNSLKFRGPKSPRIHITAEAGDTEWVISIKDNGIGIESQYLDRIFQIFQRVHSQKDIPGMGVGLAICKKIVERHGGRIWVQSKKGEGTTFFFSLPLRVETPVPLPALPLV